MMIKNLSKRKICSFVTKTVAIFSIFKNENTNKISDTTIIFQTFLKILADSATSETDRESLLYICSPNGSETYLKLISNEGKTLLGLLKKFSSCKNSLEQLLENLPAMKPRPYSISSSPLLTNELKIVFSVVYHNDGTEGLCTGYLEKINEKLPTSIDLYFRKPTKFRLPENNSTSIVMIGPGTGIAPFIGFLQHRYFLKTNEGLCFGKSWLFFGCRYSARDYLFSRELNVFLRSNVLSKFNVSFSRENPKKRYVQHNIEEYRHEFFDWIENEDAVIYVCGDGKNMADDVKKTVINVYMECGRKTLEEAKEFLKNLQDCGRYIEDVWS